ncbi:MAG: type IV toxin-antitoxin system AbiEi family antitoxin domain-containing protein [Solirubrobacterales bacterium]
MRATEAYGDLSRLDRPIVTTREAAARWHAQQRAAGQRLRAMEEAGLVRRLRRGLWALDPEIDPFVVPPFLTAPLPAYVSFWSALSQHGLIEQIPREISVASLDRARRVATTVGTYSIHHLDPGLFDGFEGTEQTGYLASAEKSLFDSVYIRAAAGSRAFFPELRLPPGFDPSLAMGWVERIGSTRLRTLVGRRLEKTIAQAIREAT